MDVHTDSSSTSLHMAVINGRVKVVCILLEHGVESGVKNKVR